MISTLASNQQDSIYSNHHDQNIFRLNPKYTSHRFTLISFPNMSNQMTFLLVFIIWVRNCVFTQPKTHQITVFKTYIASWVFVTHCNATDLRTALLAYQVAGWLELFGMRRKENSKDFCFSTERQQNLRFFNINKFFNVSSFSFTFADHFVLININEKYLTRAGSNDKSVSGMLITKCCNARKRIHLFHRYVTIKVEISMTVSIENGNLTIIWCTEDHFCFF